MFSSLLEMRIKITKENPELELLKTYSNKQFYIEPQEGEAVEIDIKENDLLSIAITKNKFT